MSDIPVNLSEIRADRHGDCCLWTVTDALRAALRDIEQGALNPDMVFIAMRELKPDHCSAYKYVTADGTNIELCGLLAKHLQRLAAR